MYKYYKVSVALNCIALTLLIIIGVLLIHCDRYNEQLSDEQYLSVRRQLLSEDFDSDYGYDIPRLYLDCDASREEYWKQDDENTSDRSNALVLNHMNYYGVKREGENRYRAWLTKERNVFRVTNGELESAYKIVPVVITIDLENGSARIIDQNYWDGIHWTGENDIDEGERFPQIILWRMKNHNADHANEDEELAKEVLLK